MESDLLIAFSGLVGGVVLGVCARWGRFCTLAAIEDFTLGGDARLIATWGFAIGTAVLGVQGLSLIMPGAPAGANFVSAPTSLFANAVGGVLFGLGMALSGTCGYGVLARLGGGDFRALVTLLAMAIAGYAAMRGLLAPARDWIAELLPLRPPVGVTMDLWLARAVDLPQALVGCALGLFLCGLGLANSRFRSQRKLLVTGFLVGLTVSAGWAATAMLQDPFEPQPLTSFTFTAPLGESLIYVMASTGMELNFGIGSVVGVVLGAAVVTLVSRQFRWEACEDSREIRRLLLGGLFMGFGGVLAFGCTVGQGISAASLLAWSAPVTLLGMYAGAWLGLHWLVDGQFGRSLWERATAAFRQSTG